MPSAKYFRAIVGDFEKPLVELSAFHLYDGNTRVDQNATLSSGFGIASGDLAVLKTDTPTSPNLLAIESATKRKTSLYVIWTFANAINVNAFRVGTTGSEATFLNKLTLQYSDDGIQFKTFINILMDKQLHYPGPWTLTELKPVGECFPFVLSAYDLECGNTVQGNCDLKDNYGFVENPNLNGTFRGPVSPTSGGMKLTLPGILHTGKMYFETEYKYNNTANNGSIYNKLLMGFYNDPTERITEPRILTAKGFALSLTYPSCTTNVSAASTIYFPYGFSPEVALDTLLPFKQFVPGVQNGFAIDFDARNLKIINPTWSDVGPGVYNAGNFKFDFGGLVGDKYKPFLLFSQYGWNFFAEMPSFNFGQKPFQHPVPAGYQAGFGPRWHEVPSATTVKNYTPFLYDKGRMPDRKDINDPVIIKDSSRLKSPIRVTHAGNYYIKGTVSRVPNDVNKRFLVQLFSHRGNKIIAECTASQSGVYEFYGVSYGLYTLYSVDLRSNIVSEAIGPLYPTEII